MITLTLRNLLLAILLSTTVASMAVAEAPSAPAATPPAIAGTSSAEAPLVVFNRKIFTFRASLYGVSAEDRARRAKPRVEELLKSPGPQVVSLQTTPLGILVQVDGATAFVVVADDADRMLQETIDGVAKRAATALERVIADTRESRSLESILRSVAIAGVATMVFGGLLWGASRLRRLARKKLVGLARQTVRRLDIGGAEQVLHDRAGDLVLVGLFIVFWGFAFLLTYEWVSILLAQFPYTRVWGEQLNGFLLGVVLRLGGAIFGAIPDLITAGAIFLLARFADQMLKSFFERVQMGQIPLTWLDADLATPTRRISRLMLWLFALAMAYPYLPGAQQRLSRVSPCYWA